MESSTSAPRISAPAKSKRSRLLPAVVLPRMRLRRCAKTQRREEGRKYNHRRRSRGRKEIIESAQRQTAPRVQNQDAMVVLADLPKKISLRECGGSLIQKQTNKSNQI